MTTDESKQFDSSRREFLTGRGAQKEIERAGERIADEILKEDERKRPIAGNTIRATTEAMACEFSVVLNQGESDRFMTASDALEIVHLLEDQMTVYRDDSELSRLNQSAYENPVVVEPGLFQLLLRSKRICQETGGAFDPTSGPLIALWRKCRSEGRVPDESEIEACLAQTGIDLVEFDEAAGTVRFLKPLAELNLGGIGKGYALDRAAEFLTESGLSDWLIHGGKSSLLASGDHEGQGGWPVGIRNPLLPHELLGTILLKDCALSTSGSGVQSFRVGGQKYGHILDPRSGRPVDGLLSVTVLAPDAALADALSTAFFVLGLEKAREYCDNHPKVSCLLIPPPHRGRRLTPINCGIPDEVLYLETGTSPRAE